VIFTSDAAIDRAAADGKISTDEAATIHGFAAFLRGEHEGCCNCMGVMRLDVAYARQRKR
jgi:hypothetical protein